MEEKTKKSKNSVVIISAVVVAILVIWAVISAVSFNAAANASFNVLTGDFGWLYCIAVAAFLFWCLYVAFSKYGKIRLGPDDSKPEYSTGSWFAMLFSAGMGIGLVFYGVAEPLDMFTAPIDVAAGSPEAALWAIKESYLHWCLHPWACFCVIGLGLAYMQFRKGKPGLISSLFIPLIGEERAKGWLGKLIDIFAIIATVLGVCTSLGLGTLQINSGLNFLFGVPQTPLVECIIVVVFTFLFTAAAVSGIEKGINFVATLNMWLVGAIIIIAFIVGPTVTDLKTLSEAIGTYFQFIIQDSFMDGAFKNASFHANWTVFFWAWWIAWGPFVGTFIARISKGRTIREFIIAVLIVPSLLTFVWFAVLGPMGIQLGLAKATEAAVSTPLAAFKVFSYYPLGGLLSIILLFLVCTFFVTSADSAVLVLGIFSEHGTLNPTKKVQLLWGCLEGVLAIVLMVSSENALTMMQTISIVGAFPFVFVELGAMFGITKGLKLEFSPTSGQEIMAKMKNEANTQNA